MAYFSMMIEQDIIDLIQNTKKALFISMPALHQEIVNAIEALAEQEKENTISSNIHILLDLDAQTIRQGYGDFDAMKKLFSQGIDVRSLADNRISFIISDQIGYYLFIESRSLIPADKKTYNAIQIDPVSIVRIKKFFFTDSIAIDFEDAITNAIIEESQKLANINHTLDNTIAPVSEIKSEVIKTIEQDLKDNPPLKPDYKRIVEFYSNKFQYVKFNFEGANLANRKIDIPSNILPVTDVKLKKKLATKLNLFDANDTKEAFDVLLNFKAKVSSIREVYLKKVKTRDESLLDKHKKTEFIEAVDELKKEMDKTKNQLITHIANQIIITKKQLKKDLIEYFIANPSAMFPETIHLIPDDILYISQVAENKADELLYRRIKWPEAHLLVAEFKLTLQFSDITYEDLKNNAFIQELKEIGLIDSDDETQLAEFSEGIEIKK
jgi:hypothetical protein